MRKGAGILLFIFLLLICGQMLGQGQHMLPVKLPGGPISIQALLDSIEHNTGFAVFYEANTLKPAQIVITQKGEFPLNKVLYILSARQILECSIVGRTIWVKRIPGRSQDTCRHVVVKVTDEDGQVLPGATIQMKHSGTMYSTGEAGTVSLPIRQPPDTVICSSVGRQSSIFILSQMTPDTIRMTPLHEELENVVVRNYYDVSPILSTRVTGSYEYIKRLNGAGSNVLESLAGRVSGLLVTPSSGVHGATDNFLLRGRNSIFNGQDPLFIIDGVPFAPGNRSVSNIVNGNAAGSLSPFSFLSVDNLESIEILKDGDATAIYGSKGANGVVLITTRRPGPGTPSLNLELSTGFSQVTERPKLMNMAQYAAMRLEALHNDGLTPNAMNAPELLLWDTTRSTDWGNYFIGGRGQNLNFHTSLTGGAPAFNYFLGMQHLQETDVFPTHPAHHLSTLTANFNHRSADERLNLNTNLSMGYDVDQQYITDVTRMQFLVPNAPPLRSEDGHLLFSSNGIDFTNPLTFIDNPYIAHSLNFISTTNAVYRIDSNLSLMTNIGYNVVHVQEQSRIPAWTQDPATALTDHNYSASTTYRNWVMEPQLKYHWAGAPLKIDLLGGLSFQGSQPGVCEHELYQALFLNLHLQWKEKLIWNFSGRRDGSSQLMSDKQYGNFGSAAFAWVFFREPAIRRLLPFISFGKLRGSYGVTGNDQIGNGYNYANTWTPAALLSSRNSSNLASVEKVKGSHPWETIIKQEIALELGLFNDRVKLTAAWFRNHSLNQLVPDVFPTMVSTTFHSRPVVLQNTGWEFNLTSKIINGDWSWATTLNASLPVNKLVSFPGLAATSLSKYLVEGQSLSSFQGLHYLGVSPVTGVYQFKDLNGDKQLTIADWQTIGKLDPVFFGGLTNTLTWHRWELSFVMEARIQRGINYQAALYANNLPGSIVSGFYSNETMDLLNRWHRPGGGSNYQRLTTEMHSATGGGVNNYLSSSALLTNASFVRLKSMYLSYRCPDPVLNKMRLHDLRVFLQGENLLTLTPYKNADPEIQNIFILPPARILSAGMQLGF